MNNQEYYQKKEFENWASRVELIPSEIFVTKNYLDPQKKTLEAGTGAGRILLQLAANNFSDLSGFDFLPEYIALAKEHDTAGTIDFQIQNAVDLSYPAEHFEQLLYLQQILCFIESAAERQAALAEAYRILKPGGRALFSFLSFESRAKSRVSAAFTRYLKIVRTLRRSSLDIQNQPWLRSNNKPNYAAILDRPPYVYWYKLAEIRELLEAAGFKILAAGSDKQLHRDKIFTDFAQLNDDTCDGTVYVVCEKL
jgi:ubiquinone/menaquinone biosynthesis C-methylase UbiE